MTGSSPLGVDVSPAEYQVVGRLRWALAAFLLGAAGWRWVFARSSRGCGWSACNTAATATDSGGQGATRTQRIELDGVTHPLCIFGDPAAVGAPLAVLVVVIPGNPGLGDFYGPLCAALDTAGSPSIALSYANFGTTPPPNGVLGIAAEAELKRRQLRALVQDHGCRLVLVGHSIGAWIVLQCLEDPALRSSTAAAVLVFPFIARDDRSPDQQRIGGLVARPIVRTVLSLFARGLCALPSALKRLLVAVATRRRPMSAQAREVAVGTLLTHPFHARAVMEMAATEFDLLDSRNDPLGTAARQIQTVCDEGIPLTALYAPDDHWGPLHHKAHLDTAIHSPLYHSLILEVDHAFPTFDADTRLVASALLTALRPPAAS